MRSLLHPPDLPANLVDRTDIVDDALRRVTNRLALTGVAGCGKTVLAATILATADEYPFRFWLRANRHETLETDIGAVGVYLGIVPKGAPSEDAMRATIRNLINRDDCLLIIDNLTQDTIPLYRTMTGLGNLLVTTQAASIPDTSTLAVPHLSIEQADELIRASEPLRNADRRQRGQITELCNHHPLALAQVVSYSQATGMGAGTQLSLLRNRRAELLDRGETTHATLTSSIDLVWQDLPPSAQQLALTLTQLADSPLPITPSGFDHRNIVDALADQLAFEDAVSALREFSIIERRDDELTMHGLVRDIVSERYGSSGTRTELAGGALFVTMMIPYWADRPGAWSLMERLEPHLIWVSERVASIDSSLAASQLNRLGTYLHSRGRNDDAQATFRRALSLLDDEDDLPTRASVSQNLANSLADVGQLDAAESLMREAIDLKLEAIGREDVLTGIGYAGLASLLQSMGRSDEARAYYENALEIYEQVGDVEQIIETKLDIANICVADNNDRAQALIDEVRISLDAVDNWMLTHAAHMTASSLHEARDEPVAAAREASRAVRVARAAAPVSHELAQALATHGRLLLYFGNYQSGVKLLEQSVEMSSRIGPSDGANAARTRGNLGLWLMRTGSDYRRAEELLRESFESLAGLFPKNSDTLHRARLMWAEALPFVGETARALDLVEEVRQAAPSQELIDAASQLRTHLSSQ